MAVLTAKNVTYAPGTTTRSTRFKVPNPICVSGGQGNLWPARIYQFILDAIEKGFEGKTVTRRFFGHYGNH